MSWAEHISDHDLERYYLGMVTDEEEWTCTIVDLQIIVNAMETGVCSVPTPAP